MNTLKHSGYNIFTRQEYFLTQSTLYLLTIPVNDTCVGVCSKATIKVY